MPVTSQSDLVRRKYREVFGATAQPAFAQWLGGQGRGADAALGYRRAGAEPLFLEAYLDSPIEVLASAALGREIDRTAIVEIGNFASDNALAMVELWGSAANDLSGESEVAVATLTAPLRTMFGRIGVPVVPLARACPERLGQKAAEWGSYYNSEPWVCVGEIDKGQAAINRFLARRRWKAAA